MRDKRRNAIYVIVLVSLITGLATGRGFFFNVAYAFGGLLVFSLLWAWGTTNWLDIKRDARGKRAQVGGYVTETFTATNTGRFTKLWLEFYDESTLPGHGSGYVVANLKPGTSTTWQSETLCTQRGEFKLGPMRVAAGDPFGLFQLERRLPQSSRVIVYPSTYELQGFMLPVGPLPGGDALRQRTHYVTTNAAGVRDYAPGDSLNRIHWKSTARKQRLLVKEFELDPLADVWVILDAERTAHAGSAASVVQSSNGVEPLKLPPSSEEYAIATAASLTKFFLMKDRAVGFISQGQRREYIQVDRGGRQLNKILETLAVLRTEGTVSFDQLLQAETNRFSRGTTLVLVTPSVRDTWVDAAHELKARGVQIVAVLVDSESFGGRPGTRRITNRLSQVHIPAYVVRLGEHIPVSLSQTVN